MKKKLIGLTGPSGFSKNIMTMLEKFHDFNYVCLTHEKAENTEFWLEMCDGLLIAGGIDIHPSIYGCNVTSGNNLSKFDIQRDMRELSVVSYGLKTRKPMLAICRGHQLLSIVLGLGNEFVMDLNGCGTIHQPGAKNITPSEADVMHCVDLLNPDLFPMVRAEERVAAIEILGEEEKKRIWVNSFHHQGVLYQPGKDGTHYSEKGITVLGTSLADWDKKHKLIELMKGDRWLSVQWHPEYDYEVNTPSRTVLTMFKNLFEGD
jgi:gamma-glutamyl-gamma-aminobutyrate hydrolase PuuD